MTILPFSQNFLVVGHHVVSFSTDLDLSHMSGDDEAYDYKFVKWMIKEKVIRIAV